MLKLAIFSVFLLSSVSATAACPLADTLVSKYGISFSGFKNSIFFNSSLEKSTEPKFSSVSNVFLVQLPNKKGYVPDGFFHTAIIDATSRKAWIHRIGGVPNVDEWYGPVDLKTFDTEGCKIEKYGETKK